MSANDKYKAESKYPQIYAYTEHQYVDKEWEGPRAGRGLLKIGYTSRRNVEERIKEQFPVIKPEETPYIIKYVDAAIDKHGKWFRDSDVHAALEKQGVFRVNGEWFECTEEELESVVYNLQQHENLSLGRNLSFGMRPEQEAAVAVTAKYFSDNPKQQKGPAPRFLWNAKMRFGKTFTTYQLAKKMGWKRILILTYKPAVQSAWRSDLAAHVDFQDWQFIGSGDEFNDIQHDQPLVWFASFQDMLGTTKEGNVKDKFIRCYDIEWDCVVLDEYHFGSWRDTAKELYDGDVAEINNLEWECQVADQMASITANHYLYLSGTPFRALQNGEFTEDQIFNWTYSDEQAAKLNWSEHKGSNPYQALPSLIMMTYVIPETVRTIALNEETNQFDLNEFFKAEGKGNDAKFLHQEQVGLWLNLIRGQHSISMFDSKNVTIPPLPYEDVYLLQSLAHTLWFLPNVAACEAMANLLAAPQHRNWSEYDVIVAAGNKAGMGEAALKPVIEKMKNPLKTKTITLTCGKLTTGVSVPAWTGIFMLRNLESPESYFQAAFRVQTPWTIPSYDGKSPDEIIKEKCYIFDFAPNRALKLIADYNEGLEDIGSQNPKEKIEEFLQFLPVLCFDGTSMEALDAGQLLDIVMSGTSANMLARRFKSYLLINLNLDVLMKLQNSPAIMEALSHIEAFRKLSNADLDTVISSEKAINSKTARKEKLTKEDKDEKNKNANWRKEVKENLIKFITRIPVFMYLTDHREECLKHVIENLEPEMFTRVTGLSVDTFKELCKIGVFHSGNINAAIYSFRCYEEKSLSYAGNAKLSATIAGFEEYSTIPRNEAKTIRTID